jgi:hypothetical protein
MAESRAKKQTDEPAIPTQTPGMVISPGSQAPEDSGPTIMLDPDGPAQPGSVTSPVDPAPIPPAPAQPDPAPPANQPGPQENKPLSETPPQPGSGTIAWTASEFVAHDKSAGWYFMLITASAAISVVVYLISKDFVSVAVVLTAALLLSVYGSHKPRQLEYRLDAHGIGIGPKSYGYEEFRSFSVVPEGAFSSIVFMPLKRFSPPISIYYAPEDEDKIVGMLSDRLPFEEGRRDAIDSLMRRIRF